MNLLHHVTELNICGIDYSILGSCYDQKQRFQGPALFPLSKLFGTSSASTTIPKTYLFLKDDGETFCNATIGSEIPG